VSEADRGVVEVFEEHVTLVVPLTGERVSGREAIG
jgi:hypothetical protein